MWATTMRSRKHGGSKVEAATEPATTRDGAISHEAALRLADRVSTGHDFGQGPVLARRHRNPDHSLGGWVADTAHADPESFVAEEAAVFGNARVFGPCLILGRARVMDFARVSGGSVVADDSQISDSAVVNDAVIGDSAVVSGSARVQGGIVRGGALVTDSARVNGGAVVQDRAEVRGLAFVTEGAVITGDTVVEGAVRGEVIVLDADVQASTDLDDEPEVVSVDASGHVAEHVDETAELDVIDLDRIELERMERELLAEQDRVEPGRDVHYF
jgi:carbonic anhydrase/acetyltransferase-like protein (isoleucine patch superfamily)